MEHNFCPHCSGRVLEILHRIERRQIMDQAQLLTDLNIANTGIRKIGAETRTLLDKVDALQQAIANGPAVTPEVEAAMNDLNSQIVIVDGLVPDAPAPAPEPAQTPDA
jgi:hypothetical protein